MSQLLLISLLSSPATSALRLHSAVVHNRRGAIATGALAALTAASPPAQALTSKQIAKAELQAKLDARKEEERLAALPINQLKAKRDSLARASDLVESEKFSELREVLTDATGNSLSKLLGTMFSGKDKGEVVALTNDLRKTVGIVDAAAYTEEQERFGVGSVLSGYCADGVVPRDEVGGCKVRSGPDKASLIEALKKATLTYDKLLAVCS